MSELSKKIRKCAYRARKKAERIAKSEGFKEDLAGFCARGSAILWAELDKENLKAQICYTWGHAYVKCEGYFIDITATQFGLTKTIVRKEETIKEINNKAIKNGHDRYWVDERISNRFNNPVELAKWQNKEGWTFDKISIESDWSFEKSQNKKLEAKDESSVNKIFNNINTNCHSMFCWISNWHNVL